MTVDTEEKIGIDGWVLGSPERSPTSCTASIAGVIVTQEAVTTIWLLERQQSPSPMSLAGTGIVCAAPGWEAIQT